MPAEPASPWLPKVKDFGLFARALAGDSLRRCIRGPTLERKAQWPGWVESRYEPGLQIRLALIGRVVDQYWGQQDRVGRGAGRRRWRLAMQELECKGDTRAADGRGVGHR